MTQLRVEVSIDDNRSFTKKLKDAVVNALRDKFAVDTKERVIDEVDTAVRQSRVEFIPSNDEAAELGVGEDGKFSEKIDDAWEGLLASVGKATQVDFRRSSKDGQIGQMTVTVDWEAFFELEDSKIDAGDSDIGIIPWMKWYIDGEVISGSQFFGGKFSFPPSRTGAGIMVEGSLWRMPPHPVGPIELNERITARLAKLAEKIAKGR